MKELNSFSKQAPYVAPTCKMVKIQTLSSLLSDSGDYNENWNTERLVGDGEEVNL